MFSLFRNSKKEKQLYLKEIRLIKDQNKRAYLEALKKYPVLKLNP